MNFISFLNIIYCFNVEKQEDNPTIDFNKETYEIGEVLKANCTTSTSRPPPHITWWINDERVSILSFPEPVLRISEKKKIKLIIEIRSINI